MKKQAVCFTSYGMDVIRRLNKAAVSAGIEPARAYVSGSFLGKTRDGDFHRLEDPLEEWAARGFREHACVIFVGACGIAVRAIAGLVSDKLSDSPVIVIDDMGQCVIPILSGHMGGADKEAVVIADLIDATPIITTSTDLHGAFAADVFAAEHNLRIVNRDGIKKVSAKAIEGRPITLSVKSYPPTAPVDIIVADETDREYSLLLAPKRYTLGIGMKRDIDISALEAFILPALNEAGIDISDIYAVCTIDVKENEKGLKSFTSARSLPIISFDKELLNTVGGDISASEFVLKTVGTDNVCERAALLGAGSGGRLIIKKKKGDGITMAVALRGQFAN